MPLRGVNFARRLGVNIEGRLTVGTNNYTIDAIAVHNLGVFAGGMSFSLTSSALSAGDRAKLVVHVGSVALKFSEADLVDAAKTYEFESTGLDWSSESFVTLRLRDTPVTNNAPVFSPTTATREVAENSAAGTNVGAVIPEATDADSGDTLTYSMEGTDAASFDFDASTRQITTITGVTYNFEATKNSYSVTVRASDGTASATIAVTIDVTDVNEKSAKPDKPTLAAVTGSSTTLTATWTKPGLNGGPDIATYIVQYREGTTGVWTTEYNGNALTTTITGLTADTSYQVQVRANNGEVLSDWSDASDAVKTNAAAVAPTISAVAVTSTPVLETDTYGAGERIEVTVTFSEAVNATSDTDFVLSVAGAKRAPLVRGSGTATLVFGYTVVPGDEDDNGIWIGDQDRTLVGNRDGDPQNGTITSVATSTAADLTHAELGQQSGHKVDGSRSIVSVAVSSTPMLETDTYGAGETIRFTVTFNVAVDVSGDPVLTFALGNQGQVRDVDAAHEGGGGSTALVFAYTVVSTDEDNNGIFLRDEDDFNNPDGPVRLDSDDTIRFAGTSTDVPLYWQGRGTQSGHKVDGSRTTGNTAPSFTSSATFDAAENQTAVGTVVAADSDADDNITGYAITGGADQALFEIGTTTGELTFDNAPNFEDPEDSGTDNTYVVTVEATSGTGTREMTATQTITVTVTDADEKSAKPDKPTLAKVTGSSTSLTATWTKPDLDGGPEITGYAVQYKVNTATTWEDFAHSDTAVTTTITGLTADTSYQVQVRAKNGETDSDWSDASDAVKTNAEMSTPTCTLNTGDLWCGVVTVEELVFEGTSFAYGFVDASASPNPSDTGALSNENFTVTLGTIPYTIDVATVGLGATAEGLNFSLTSALTAADLAKLVLHVDGGSGTFAFSDATRTNDGFTYQWSMTGLDWTSETSVTLRLRLAPEAPGKPTNLMAEADGGTRIALSWDAPADDGGSAITGYRIEVSDDAGSNWEDLVDDTGNDDTTYTHEGLSPGDTRHYRVSAINAEGASVASDVADATTAAAATETDATLSALTVTRSGGATVPLRPAFAPGTGEYRAWVANRVDEVTVAATANVAAAEVAYLDGDGAAIADADTNTPGREVALEVGATVVEVKVTAEDGTTMRTYRVTVTRRAVDAPGVEGELRLTETEPYADEDNDRYGGTAGRVEVSHAGAWGTVCSDGIRYSTFSTFNHDANGDLVMDSDGNPTETKQDNEAAALICKAKDYDDGEYYRKYSKYRLGAAEEDHQVANYWSPNSSYPADGPKPIWLDELRCVAGEPALGTDPLPGAMSHCSYAGWGLHNCTHKEDAVVRCWNNDAAGPGLKSLKGRFVSPPERHDGTNRVKVRVAFSEPVEESPENVGAHGVEVEGGEVTSVSPVGGDAPDGAGTRSAGGRNAGGEDREVVWEFEIEPDSDGDLTVTLEAGRPCGEPGAICTADGRALSEGISTTVEGPEAPPPLTASFENMPEAHDGESAFRFRVAFSENIGISYRSLREDAFAVSGGRVTRGKRVDDRRDLFEMTVEPEGDGEVTVTLPAGRECSVSGAICTKGENRRQLTNAPTATVAGPAVETGPAGLTARFVDMPSEHDGETAFKFRIAFSEEIRMSGRRLRSDVVAVSGGRATKAGRVNRPKDLWKLKVRPDSLADVTVTLSSGAACDTLGAVCTADGRALSNTISATVEGPVAVSVADARVREAAGATLDFEVSLSRAAAGPVSVTWATADGSATAGSDYRAGQGKLRFAPGETEKTIPVPVLDDAHDEGEETMQLRLTASSGAAIADGVATGTIENTDHMPAAWLARFGRTVTDQVLGAVEARLSAPRAAGARATLAGQALPSWDAANDDATAAADPGTGSGAGVSERGLAARDRDAMTAIRDWMARAGTDGSGAGANGSGADAWRGEGRDDRTRSRALTGRDFLTGTSFALTGGSAEAGGYAALWGRGAISRFDGREGDLTLDGEVTTGLMGADWASAPGSRRWTAGLAFGHARGTGGYREGGGCEEESCAGEVEATLTGLWPYAGLTLTDRLSAWAAAGYGAGELTLTPGGGSPFTADLTMAMGAAGMRGEVLTPPPDGGLALALKGDARFTRTASEATKDAKGGNLAAATADVWLLRTGVEGSRRFALQGDADGMVLTPSFEIGARLDGGDAETGLGVDLGGGLAFAAPKQGVALDLKARGLIAHQASGFREWGASASLTWDPRPTTDRGFALTLRQGWGGSPTGGMDALLRRETLAGLAANDNGDTTASTGRLEAELGYGIALLGGGFTGTPHLGFGLSDTGRDYRVGWRLTSARRGDPGFQVDLDATRREAADADAEHGIVLRCTMRW